MAQLTVSSTSAIALPQLLLNSAKDDFLVVEKLHFAILKREESGFDL